MQKDKQKENEASKEATNRKSVARTEMCPIINNTKKTYQLVDVLITKTRLFKYTENFATKKIKFSDKKI